MLVILASLLALLLLGLFARRQQPAQVSAPGAKLPWKVYLNKITPLRPGCINGDSHIPMVLAEQSSGPYAICCQVCSDALPSPEWLVCDDCHKFAIDGYFIYEPCDTHQGSP